MNVSRRRPIFNRQPESNVYRMFFWSVLILGGVWMIRSLDQGGIKPIGVPTPTATRVSISYTAEGDAQFTSGDLDAAITSYHRALDIDPTNAEVWAKMARIQVYASEYKTTDRDKRAALNDALVSIDRAKELAPDDSVVAAIRAFVLDWNANPRLNPGRVTELLTQSEQEANRALSIDPQNALALAFFAEIMTDQLKLSQAEQYISQAQATGQGLMDFHRVYGYLLESERFYNQAIQEYDKAIAINPKLTFLYLRAGANYRQLAFTAPKEQQGALYDKSLEYFDKAAKINEQLKVNDPIPYLSIAKTYSQLGEFSAASRNVQKALKFKPEDADIFGQLGIVYFKSRNYEGAIPILKCAIRGCTAIQSCQARYERACNPAYGEVGADIQSLPLSPNTVVYYYTYGSVLAALSRPKQNYCSDAAQVFDEIRAQFSGDSLIMGIVLDGEAICANVGKPTQILGMPTPVGGTNYPTPHTPELTVTPTP
jgi:tetratricopeptide (TPR) repeat protein